MHEPIGLVQGRIVQPQFIVQPSQYCYSRALGAHYPCVFAAGLNLYALNRYMLYTLDNHALIVCCSHYERIWQTVNNILKGWIRWPPSSSFCCYSFPIVSDRHPLLGTAYPNTCFPRTHHLPVKYTHLRLFVWPLLEGDGLE